MVENDGQQIADIVFGISPKPCCFRLERERNSITIRGDWGRDDHVTRSRRNNRVINLAAYR